MTVPSTRTDAQIRFGAFELDARSGELRSDGRTMTLAEQPLRVLLALLERQGQVVTRDELRQQLWPDDTFVDYEHGLNTAVRRLREALGDSADVPRYVETLPRRGYRLIAPVPDTGQAPDPAEPAATRSSSIDLALPGRRLLMPLLGGVLIAAALGLAAWLSDDSRSDTAPARSGARALTRLTFGDGLQTDVTWSPDGTRIAYASDRGGNLDIWVQALDGSDPVLVASSPAPDSQPAWSPGGDTIVFRSERDGGGLYLVSASGGAARRLTAFGHRPAWHPDGGEVLFITSETPGTVPRTLHSVVPDGATPPRELLGDFLRDGAWSDIAPRADGRVTAIGYHRSDGFGVYAVSLDGHTVEASRPPESMTIDLGLDEARPTLRGQWSPTGSALYLEVTPDELSTVWRVPATNYSLRWEEAERLTSGPGDAVSIAMSPDGRRLAFTSELRRTRAWVFPFDPVAGGLSGSGRPVTPEDLTIGNLRLVPPDGRSIVYAAWRAGRRESDVMLTDTDTGATELVASNARGVATSPDGQTITYRLVRPRGNGQPGGRVAGREFAAAARDRAGSERLLSAWSSNWIAITGDWLPDGSAALTSYWNPYPLGTVALVLWPLDSGPATEPRRVLLADPARRFWQATFSPDGRHLSFVASATGAPGRLALGVMDVTSTPARWTRIAADHGWADKPRWSPDGRTLYFISRKSHGYYNVWGIRMDPIKGTPTSEPFQVTRFDSSAQAIDPNMSTSEISMVSNRLALTIARTTGSIWMLSNVDR